MTEKFTTKISISPVRKGILRQNKIAFSSLLKGFQLPENISDLRVKLNGVVLALQLTELNNENCVQ